MESENVSLVEITTSVEKFEKVFNDYFRHLFEFIEGKFRKNTNPYYISHPELIFDAIRLQTSFFKLPDIVQERILSLDFEVFLHCDNVVDFYSFREFLSENWRYNKATMIAERVDAELKLVKEFISNDIWEKYSNLPKRDFYFYRQETVVSLLSELKDSKNVYINQDSINEQIERVPSLLAVFLKTPAKALR